MDQWLPQDRRSRHQRDNYPYEHYCGYCGALGYRHRATGPKATLFCATDCAKAYKRQHAQPRHESQRLSTQAILTARTNQKRLSAESNALIRELMRYNINFQNRPWRAA